MNLRTLLLFLPLLATAAGCDGSSTGPDGNEIDIDALFRPATAAEVAAVEAEWDSRNPSAAGVAEEYSTSSGLSGTRRTVHVFSHLVDGNRHYGMALVPEGAAGVSLPVLLYAHPGDRGVNLLEVEAILAALGSAAAGYVIVVPSFRSETLTVGTRTFTSGGSPSPWDRDVDDALALLDVALQEIAVADASRIGVLGFSRGGGVGLLLGIRDSRFDVVVEIAGPTDFFGPYVRSIVEDAIAGQVAGVPGAEDLNEQFIEPFLAGTISEEQFRRELIRRSAVLFADRLPPTQVHHGTADDIVAVSQAESLGRALEDQPGRQEDELFLYPGAGHNPLEMIGIASRVATFLAEHLAPATVTAVSP